MAKALKTYAYYVKNGAKGTIIDKLIFLTTRKTFYQKGEDHMQNKKRLAEKALEQGNGF